ncbi:hypothetical protein EDF56_102245 [Novosphingobium sp. PhB165]|nr:hypothetical protein EDF56_102245 [Novosphingobium sp. PhB165]
MLCSVAVVQYLKKEGPALQCGRAGPEGMPGSIRVDSHLDGKTWGKCARG